MHTCITAMFSFNNDLDSIMSTAVSLEHASDHVIQNAAMLEVQEFHISVKTNFGLKRAAIA